jgi:hypothetical protein
MRLSIQAAGRTAVDTVPNVKDEPRPWLARRVQRDDLESEVSFGASWGSTRGDSHGRWLWRFVRRILDEEIRDVRAHRLEEDETSASLKSR